MKKILCIVLAAVVVGVVVVTVATSSKCGDSLIWNFDEKTGTLTISGEGVMGDYSDIGAFVDYNYPWEKHKVIIRNIVINDGATTIGDYAFSDCTNLKNITIPDSVTTIGDGAFLRCTNLTSITIPDSVTSIGSNAFAHCTQLTKFYGEAGSCAETWANENSYSFEVLSN